MCISLDTDTFIRISCHVQHTNVKILNTILSIKNIIIAHARKLPQKVSLCHLKVNIRWNYLYIDIPFVFKVRTCFTILAHLTSKLATLVFPAILMKSWLWKMSNFVVLFKVWRMKDVEVGLMDGVRICGAWLVPSFT